jgi:succinoglycan biosynthesis transport protein ExoP
MVLGNPMQDKSSEAAFPPASDDKRIARINPSPQPVLLDAAPDYPEHHFSGEETGDDLAVTLRRYFQIFFKHRWLIVGVLVCITTLGVLRGFMMTPLYVSTATIQIDAQAMKIVDGDAATQTGGSTAGAEFQRTHYELLKSRAMAERVVSSLQLQNDTEFLNPRNASFIGWFLESFRSGNDAEDAPASARQAAATAIVASHIAVRPIAGSRLVNLTFSDPSPQRAQRIANAYADAYVASNLDKRFEANSYAKLFLDDQIKQLKLRLEDSEKALLQFAESEKIVQATDKESIADNNLAAANVALGQLVSERIRNEQTWRQVQEAGEISLPQLLSNRVIDGLRERGKELKREYEEKLSTFKPGYPAMVEISTKIKEIEHQIASEVATVKASLKAAYEASLNQEKEMRARIEQLRTEVLDLQKKSIRYNILQREVETNRGLYNSLLQRYKEVDIASGVGTNNIFIVDRALPAGAPSEPRMLRILMISLLLGIALGLGLAYVLDLFDDYIRTPEQAEEVSNLSTLGVIPLVSSEEELAAAANDPRSPLSEAYRSLATALQFSTEAGLPRSIVVTSAGPSEGKSSIALAISRHFAAMGLNVLLVDGDLRKPSLHARIGKSSSVGLSNYLTGAATSPDLVQHTDIQTLKFIASGPIPPNAGDLLGGSRIFSLISAGREIFDLIVIDAPPMMGITDAQLLSNAAAATVFVVSAGQSRRGGVRNALRNLKLARVTPIGVILTKFDQHAAGYGYGYGYGHNYGHDLEERGQDAVPESLVGTPEKPKIAAYGIS